MKLSEIREANRTITEENIKQIRDTIDTILTTGVIAHEEGLLGLDEFTTKNDYELLNIGINLVVDGTDPDLTRKILENKYYANGNTSVDALCDLMIIEGILHIQEGINPIVIEKIIRSMICDRIDSKLEESLCQMVRDRYKKSKANKRTINASVKRTLDSEILTAEEIKELLQNFKK